jgi:hypothetical protein
LKSEGRSSVEPNSEDESGDGKQLA